MSIILPQAIAPATGTALFAFSIQNSDIMGGHLIWAILLIISKSYVFECSLRRINC